MDSNPMVRYLAHLAAARVEVSRQLADIKAEARQAVQRWQNLEHRLAEIDLEIHELSTERQESDRCLTPPTATSRLTAIEDIADEYLTCRDLGHLWAAYDVQSAASWEIERMLRCRQCSTIRVQVLTLDGYLMPGKSHYIYPENQQDSEATLYVPKGIGRLSIFDGTAIRILSTNQMKGAKR